MTTQELAELARACRAAQRRESRERTPESLEARRAAEQQLDFAVLDILAGRTPAPKTPRRESDGGR